jgi:hypothetical protein
MATVNALGLREWLDEYRTKTKAKENGNVRQT